MSNLASFDTSSLPDVSHDLELLERVNPVFNTAKMTLFALAASGYDSAKDMACALGLTKEDSDRAKEPDEQTISNIVTETRFRATGTLAQQSGCGTVVDLPCGYTPRSIEFANAGLPYVGLDLPATILEAEPAAMSLLSEDKKGLVRYAGVDATNYASLKEVCDQIEGDVCFTTEGLLMYFTDSETGQLCDNIRRILADHGGCWILADAETVLQYILTARAFYGDRFMEVMMRRAKDTSKRSDVEVKSRTLVVNPQVDAAKAMREAMTFLGRHGLRAERVILADCTPELASLGSLPEEQAAQIKESMRKVAYWKITAIPAMPLEVSEETTDKLGLEATLEGTCLNLTLRGRMDTLTAPNVLDFFERTAASHTIDEVRVDCSELAYVSSAGLRVIIAMHKACEGGVALNGVNDNVREILDQTGFDTFLTIS